MDNEIIKLMKEIVDMAKEEDHRSEEIKMWRERYLHEIPKYDDTKYAAKVWMSFLSTPSVEFAIRSPKYIIKDIENFLEGFK